MNSWLGNYAQSQRPIEADIEEISQQTYEVGMVVSIAGFKEKTGERKDIISTLFDAITVITNTAVDVSSDMGRVFSCYTLSLSSGLSKSPHYLVITSNNQIVEIKPYSSKEHNVASSTAPAASVSQVGKVIEVHELDDLLKLRYKISTREGALIMEFRSGRTFKYVMMDPIKCVQYLSGRMKVHGIRGCITKTSREEKARLSAQGCLERVLSIEAQFAVTPTFGLIEEIMDLLRCAAEKLDEVGDESFIAVITYIREFLSRREVLSVVHAHPTAKVDQDDPIYEPYSSPAQRNSCLTPCRGDLFNLPTEHRPPMSPLEEREFLEAVAQSGREYAYDSEEFE
jgi:hypothetical protein